MLLKVLKKYNKVDEQNEVPDPTCQKLLLLCPVEDVRIMQYNLSIHF